MAVADDEPVLLAEVAAELEVVARAIGDRERLQVHGSLWLLIRSYKTRVHDRATVEAIVDDLTGTGMRLPVSSGAALFAWAYGAGILP